MKKTILIWYLAILTLGSFAQPAKFDWTSRHNGFNYISEAKDQKEQGPCRIFASVAAVEAITQIYFNKTQNLNLSESNIYSGGIECSGRGCNIGSATVEESLDLFENEGVVNEDCFKFPMDSPWCRLDCNNICDNPQYKITIPDYEQLNITSNTQLKYNILDKGPIIVSMANVGHVLHPGESTGINHTVLIVGWKTEGSTNYWYIKDSWPDHSSIAYNSINIFNYSPIFYSVKPVSSGSTIGCTGTGCSAITSRFFDDHDHDGFYNWGMGNRPSGCTGPGKMDFDDNNNSVICLNSSYMPQSKPAVTGANFVCQTGASRTFTLSNLPQGFTATWSVSPTAYFNSPLTGSGVTATINPKSDVGKQCTITYTITDGIGTASYSKSFVINGPREDQVSVTVEDAYGQTPMYVSGVWLLCPNSTYYLYVNNNSGCSTTGYTWTLPSAWTKYWQSGNIVAINTNSNPSGTANIYATTCCAYFKIKTQHFSSGGNCSKSTSGSSKEDVAINPNDKIDQETPDNLSVLRVYPNPASNELTISINDESNNDTEEISIEIFDINSKIIFRSQNMAKESKIQTDGWKDGLYYIRVKHNDKYYYSKISILKGN